MVSPSTKNIEEEKACDKKKVGAGSVLEEEESDLEASQVHKPEGEGESHAHPTFGHLCAYYGEFQLLCHALDIGDLILRLIFFHFMFISFAMCLCVCISMFVHVYKCVRVNVYVLVG